MLLYSIWALFTCRTIICSLITGILSTAALVKLCHNKTVSVSAHTQTHTRVYAQHTSNGNCGFVFNLEDKNMMYLSLRGAGLLKIIFATVFVGKGSRCESMRWNATLSALSDQCISFFHQFLAYENAFLLPIQLNCCRSQDATTGRQQSCCACTQITPIQSRKNRKFV